MIEKTPIYKMLMRAKTLNDSVAWFDAFKKNPRLKSEIIQAIQDMQLKSQGVDSRGEVVGYYSMATEKISNGKKKFNTPYTLEYTGDFYKSMFVQVYIDALVIGADTAKMEDKEWWRDEILGLTDENLIIFVSKLRKSYISYARRILFNH